MIYSKTKTSLLSQLHISKKNRNIAYRFSTVYPSRIPDVSEKYRTIVFLENKIWYPDSLDTYWGVSSIYWCRILIKYQYIIHFEVSGFQRSACFLWEIKMSCFKWATSIPKKYLSCSRSFISYSANNFSVSSCLSVK